MKPSQFQITKVSQQTSHYTKQPVFAVFFKADDGRSYKTWLDPKNGNYRRWEGLMKVGNVITGVNLKGNGNLVDADSFPRLVKVEQSDSSAS